MITFQDSLLLRDAVHRTPGPIDHALAEERIAQIMTGSFAIMQIFPVDLERSSEFRIRPIDRIVHAKEKR